MKCQIGQPEPELDWTEIRKKPSTKARIMEMKKQTVEQVKTDVPEGICCVCGHGLASHIDEGDGHRCHSLGDDMYQCECYLRKGRYENISGYDLKKRLEEFLEDFKKETRGLYAK